MYRKIFQALTLLLTFNTIARAEYCIGQFCYNDLEDFKKKVEGIEKSVIKSFTDIQRHNYQIPNIIQDAQELKARTDDNENEISTNKERGLKNQENITKNNTLIKINQKGVELNKKGVERNSLMIYETNKKVKNNASSIDRLSNEFSGFEAKSVSHFRRIDETLTQNHKKAMAGISAAMAMNAIPFIEGKSVSMGFGSGSYGGQGALAFGSQFRVNDAIRSSTYISYDSNKNLGIAAGVAFGW